MQAFLSSLTGLAAQHATGAVSKFISDRVTDVQSGLAGSAPTPPKMQVREFNPEELKQTLMQALEDNPEAVQKLLQQWDPDQVMKTVQNFNQTNPKGAPDQKIATLTNQILQSKGEGCCMTWVWILLLIMLGLLIWWLLCHNKK